MDVSQILPNLFVGSYPDRPEDIDRLRREFGVTAVLNVQTDDDMAYWGVNWYGDQKPQHDQGHGDNGEDQKRYEEIVRRHKVPPLR